MRDPETYLEDSNSGDAKLMGLIQSHRDAMQAGDYSEVDRAGMEVLDRAMEAMLEAAEKEGLPDDFVLHAIASECEERGDWDGAIAAYRQEIELVKCSPSSFSMWKPRDGLANLYFLLDDHASALREQQLATDAARADDLAIGLRIALIAEATMLLRLEWYSEAESRAREGLALPNASEPFDELGPAKLTVLLAGCKVGEGSDKESRELLREAYPILSRAELMPGAAGYHSGLLMWWWVEASCCEVTGDHQHELEALNKSLRIARHIDSLGHCEDIYTKASVMRVLGRVADAYWRFGRFDEARSHRQAALDIRRALKLPVTSTDS